MAAELILHSMIIRPSDSSTLVEGSLFGSKYVKEAKKIGAKLIESLLKPDERKVVNSKNGKWYSECDANNIYYSVLANENYP